MRWLLFLPLLVGCVDTARQPTKPKDPPPRIVTIPCPTRADPRTLFAEVYEIPKDGSRYYYEGHWYKVNHTGRGKDGWYMQLQLDEKETQKPLAKE